MTKLHSIRKITAFLLLISMLVSVFPLFETAEAALQETEGPRVTQVRGDTWLYRGGGYAPITIYRGMLLQAGDLIETGVESSVALTYYGKDITVGELTRLSIDSLWNKHNRDDSSISLIEGMVKNKVHVELNKNSRNVIRASNTIAGVRGTEYILIYSRMGFPDYGDENPYVRIKVIEGTVRFDLEVEDDDGKLFMQTFLISADGIIPIEETLDGEQVPVSKNTGLKTFTIPVKDLDTTILEGLVNNEDIIANNPDFIQNIIEELEIRSEQGEENKKTAPEKPPAELIFDSESDEILPNLPVPEIRGEPDNSNNSSGNNSNNNNQNNGNQTEPAATTTQPPMTLPLSPPGANTTRIVAVANTTAPATPATTITTTTSATTTTAAATTVITAETTPRATTAEVTTTAATAATTTRATTVTTTRATTAISTSEATTRETTPETSATTIETTSVSVTPATTVTTTTETSATTTTETSATTTTETSATTTTATTTTATSATTTTATSATTTTATSVTTTTATTTTATETTTTETSVTTTTATSRTTSTSATTTDPGTPEVTSEVSFIEYPEIVVEYYEGLRLFDIELDEGYDWDEEDHRNQGELFANEGNSAEPRYGAWLIHPDSDEPVHGYITVRVMKATLTVEELIDLFENRKDEYGDPNPDFALRWNIEDLVSPPTPHTATYGTTLFNIALPSGGQFSWEEDQYETTVGDVGIQQFTVLFTILFSIDGGPIIPNPNYNPIELNVTIEVLPKQLIIASVTHTKQYDGSNIATSGAEFELSGILPGDEVNVTSYEIRYAESSEFPHAANAGNTLINMPTITIDNSNYNYTGYPEYPVSGITPANSTLNDHNEDIPDGFIADYGSTLGDLDLSDFPGWSWESPTTPVGETGTRTHSMSFLPFNNVCTDDCDPMVCVPYGNYLPITGIEVEIEVGDAPPGSSESNPFEILGEADLRKVGTGVDGWNLNSHYKLMGDITLTGTNNWTPIGLPTIENRFIGTFNGNGYLISGLNHSTGSDQYIDRSGAEGLFGAIGAGGVVKNLGVEVNYSFGQSNVDYIGTIAGHNYGTIEYCYSLGSITGGGRYKGAIASYNYGPSGTIRNCVALNTSVGSEGHRITNSSGTLRDNYSNRDMTSNSVTSFGLNQISGERILSGNVQTVQDLLDSVFRNPPNLRTLLNLQ